MPAGSVWARVAKLDIPIRFGPEFTFYAPEPTRAQLLNKILIRQYNHLVLGQSAGAEFRREPINKYVSPNGWYFDMNTDPGVIEVQMKPMTWWEFDHFKVDIQDAIFTSAAIEGAFPALYAGGGHINIGVEEIIKDSPLLMRNFLADLINHSELLMGVFGYDTNNALPFPLFKDETQTKIKAQFEAFDRGEIDISTLMARVDGIQQTQDDLFLEPWGFGSPRGKMTGFSMINVVLSTGHMELRGVRPQANMDVWVNQIRLLYKRIMYLRTKTKPIRVNPIVQIITPLIPTHEAHVLNPPVNPQDALRAFHRYMAELGERWEDHRGYLWPKWISDGEVERYEASETFRKLQRKTCGQLMEARFLVNAD